MSIRRCPKKVKTIRDKMRDPHNIKQKRWAWRHTATAFCDWLAQVGCAGRAIRRARAAAENAGGGAAAGGWWRGWALEGWCTMRGWGSSWQPPSWPRMTSCCLLSCAGGRANHDYIFLAARVDEDEPESE